MPADLSTPQNPWTEILEKPTSKNEFDAYRTTYADAVNSSISFSGLDLEFFNRAKAARLLSLLKKHFGRIGGLSGLDVGCGVGTYYGLLEGHVGRLTGVDTSLECLDEARSNRPHGSYTHYDGGRLPFTDGQFDFSYAICVMHHVPKPQWALFAIEMVRVTRRGGLVMLFEHNPYNPLTRRAVSNCAFDANAVLLTKREAMRYFIGAGLRGVTGRYILTLPSISGILRFADDYLGAMLPIGAQYYIVGCPT
jgi:ubiquinone/menaquinone biosynthesis C-methylase UbiE